MPRAGRVVLRKTGCSGAASSWRATVLDAGNIATSPIRFRRRSRQWREALYTRLAPIANDWNERLGLDVEFPRRSCGVSGALPRRGRRHARHPCCFATRRVTTTACIRISTANTSSRCRWRCCSRSLARISKAVSSSSPSSGRGMQSRVEVLNLRQGDAAVFAVSHRPVEGSRGNHRVNLRHGVSRIRSGERHTLGLIFHDAD